MGCFTSSAGAGCCAYRGCGVRSVTCRSRVGGLDARALFCSPRPPRAEHSGPQALLQTRRRSGARVLWLERRYLRPWAPCGSGGVEQRPSARSTRALDRPLECDAEVTSREYSSAAPARALRPGAGLFTSLAGASWACGLRSAVSGTCWARRRARRASSVSLLPRLRPRRACGSHGRPHSTQSAGGAEPGFSG